LKLYAGLLAGWTLVIFWATLTPSDSLPDSGLFEFPYFDKVAHLGLFLVFAFLLCGALWYRGGAFLRKIPKFSVTMLMVLLLSIFIEFTQKMIPGRDYEILDILANLTGALIGFLAFELKLKKFSRLN